MKTRQKKAQFYIITSLIIAVILAGLTATVNYAVIQPQPIKFYDLSSEFQAESSDIIDYGIIKKQDIDKTINDFTVSFLQYAQERDPNLELVYVYGNKDLVTVVNYAHGSGVMEAQNGSTTSMAGGSDYGVSKVEFKAGEKIFSRDITERMEHFQKIKSQLDSPGDWIRLQIAGEIHDFNLAQEKEFLVVMKTTTSTEDIHVTQTEQYKLHLNSTLTP